MIRRVQKEKLILLISTSCFKLKSTFILKLEIQQVEGSNPLTAPQIISKLVLLHAPQHVHGDLQESFSAAHHLLLFLIIQVLLIIWPEEPLDSLQLLLHQGHDVLLKLLKHKHVT